MQAASSPIARSALPAVGIAAATLDDAGLDGLAGAVAEVIPTLA